MARYSRFSISPLCAVPIFARCTKPVVCRDISLPGGQQQGEPYIDKLVEGDQFLIRTLDETLTYEVDQILIVLPEEVDALRIEEGKDFCTLVTCTPYGVNTHRLLVRGHRVETVNDLDIRVTADAIQVEPMIVAPIVAAPMLLILILLVLIKPSDKKQPDKKKSDRKRSKKS